MSQAAAMTDDTRTIRMQVKNLHVEVADGGEKILKGVSFDLEAGKIFALVGESGSGKSVT
jgi:ABC-type glutathione transport system ATPase component